MNQQMAPTYARFRDDQLYPRWRVGGNTKGWISCTKIQCPKNGVSLVMYERF